jgi:putative ABC transport system permease protein
MWQEIWSTITKNRLRSILTGFGVFWGLLMLIILIGLGNSLEGGMRRQFAGFATNSCFFWTHQTSVAYHGFRKGRFWSMNMRDVEMIRQKADAAEYVSPMLFIDGSDKNVVRGQKSGNYSVVGVMPDYFKLQSVYVLSGRLFNEMDEKDKRKLCVIGKEVYKTLFNDGENAVGQYIRVNGIYFQIIGIMEPKSRGVSVGSDPETSVLLPFATTQVTFNQGQNIYFLGCTAKSGFSAEIVENQVKAILRQAHEIAPDDETAVGSFNLEKTFKMFDYLFLGIHILILFVGLGALLSGIIGISNIMLVTVRERTREIGVRRALGAKPITILVQILSESFVLTAIAGFAGFLFAILVLEVIYRVMIANPSPEQIFIPPFVSFGTAVWAMAILIAAGVSAGLMPALRALKIKPIDAIRDE